MWRVVFFYTLASVLIAGAVWASIWLWQIFPPLIIFPIAICAIPLLLARLLLEAADSYEVMDDWELGEYMEKRRFETPGH